MNSIIVDELDITNVEQKEIMNGVYLIGFKIHEFYYGVWIEKHNENNNFYPKRVVHVTFETDCSLCGAGVHDCYMLKKNIDELFRRLITFNSIRLYWLYLEHK